MMAEHDAQLDVCKEKWSQVDKHFAESIPVRDCVKELQMRVLILEKGVMKNAIVGGLIGALIGSGSAPAINGVVKILMGF